MRRYIILADEAAARNPVAIHAYVHVEMGSQRRNVTYCGRTVWAGAEAAAEPPFILLRDHRPWGRGIEVFDDEETAFYGARVIEGFCPNLHTDDADVDDAQPRRLIPGRGDGAKWGECEECGALWRVRPRTPYDGPNVGCAAVVA